MEIFLDHYQDLWELFGQLENTEQEDLNYSNVSRAGVSKDKEQISHHKFTLRTTVRYVTMQ